MRRFDLKNMPALLEHAAIMMGGILIWKHLRDLPIPKYGRHVPRWSWWPAIIHWQGLSSGQYRYSTLHWGRWRWQVFP